MHLRSLLHVFSTDDRALSEQCWCGGASTDYTAHGESTACDMECPGEADTVCGGHFAMTVWAY